MDSHRFDHWARIVAYHTTRRSNLCFVASALHMTLSSEDGAARNTKRRKRKHKEKGKGNDKGKRNPDPAASCSGGSCARELATDTDRDYCEFICRQCDVAGRQFCITESDPFDPAKVAACRGEGLRCCDGNRVDVKKFDNAHRGLCNRSCGAGEAC